MRILSITIALVLCACGKPQDTATKLQMDKNVADFLNLLNFGPKLQLDVCLRTPLYVFVGNGDEAFSTPIAGSISPGGRAPARVPLEEIVKFQVGSLRNALAENDCGFVIESARENGYDVTPKATLLVITDGEKYGDSSIEVTHFLWNDKNQWTPAPEYDQGSLGFDRWQIDENNKVTKLEEGKTFEIHLPTQTEAIVRYFKDHSDDYKYDQFIYMFKSHGMRYASAPFDNDLVSEMSQFTPEDVTKNHAFLFDRHGPTQDKDYASGLYKPYWKPLDGCLALTKDERITPEFIEENAKFCTCASTLRKSEYDLGVFATCEKMRPADADLFGNGIFDGLGGSKSLLYRSYMTLDAAAEITTKNPNGINRIAAAVSYDMAGQAVEGLSTWKLPAGSYPTLVLLDSCYGSPKVGNIIEPAEGVKADGTPRTNYVTTVTSDIQVGDNITTYGALNATKYQLLTFLPVWAQLKSGGEEGEVASTIWKTSVRLALYMGHDGLIDLKWVEKTLQEEREAGENPTLEDVMRRARFENDNPYRYFNLSVFPERG